MTDTKLCSGNVPMVLAAQPSKQNSEYFLIGALQSPNPPFWGTTYVPYDTPNRLYPGEVWRPSFYDEGCFSPQCDLQTMNTCTRISNVKTILKPNWNDALNALYQSQDTFASSETARAFSMIHNQLAGSTNVPMPGLSVSTQAAGGSSNPQPFAAIGRRK
jgi:hypothetical protein